MVEYGSGMGENYCTLFVFYIKNGLRGAEKKSENLEFSWQCSVSLPERKARLICMICNVNISNRKSLRIANSASVVLKCRVLGLILRKRAWKMRFGRVKTSDFSSINIRTFRAKHRNFPPKKSDVLTFPKTSPITPPPKKFSKNILHSCTRHGNLLYFLAFSGVG